MCVCTRVIFYFLCVLIVDAVAIVCVYTHEIAIAITANHTTSNSNRGQRS